MAVQAPVAARSPFGRGMQGFTLLELMVAFAIAILVLAVAPVALMKAHEAAQYRSTVREVISDLRAARNQSVITGRAVSFDLDLHGRSFGIGGRLRSVPGSLMLDAILATSEMTGDGRGSIRFFPDGSSTGGSIMITRQPSGDGVRLRVDWLLGRVTQEALGG